jgi:uncharacterized protein YggE
VAQHPLISVRGAGIVETAPEIARVLVTVTARSKDRAEVLTALAQRRADVTALLAIHGAAVEKIEEGSTHVRPDFRTDIKGDRGKERITGYYATTRFEVTITDFTVLGDIVASLAGQEGTSISGPSWHLRTDSPVRRAARTLAAKDALVRAREYADAFGSKVVELVELADVGMLSDSGGGSDRYASRTAIGVALSGGWDEDEHEPSFDFTPVAQTVHEQVDARFVVEAPDLLSDTF